MPEEIETKFKIDSALTFRKSLKRIGAEFISKEFERDIYYRSPVARRRFSAVRLRSTGDKGIFTIKSTIRGGKSGAYKIRRELETGIADVKAFGKMLLRLGFAARFRKEKIREMYKWKDAGIFIDKLPFMGFYVEIEAPKKRIKEVTRLLNLDIKKAIPHTYMQLFNRYKILHKNSPLELVFQEKGVKF